MSVVTLAVRGARAEALGLPVQTLTRLGSYVVFAGKNGSGKSRILRYATETINVAAAVDVDSLRAQLDNYKQQHENYREQPYVQQEMRRLASEISDVEAVVFEGLPGKAISFLPSAAHLSNPDDMAKSVRINHSEQLQTGAAEQWAAAVLPYIDMLQHRWREATHQNTLLTTQDTERAIERYTSLNEALKQFFGEDLGRDIDGAPTIYGRRMALAELSSGQKIALQLIAGLHAQADSLGVSVLVMDEPENHLHPAALVYLLARIRKYAPNVQVWIATHSIPLLAYINSFQPNAIWGVVDGRASFAGRKVEDVVTGLLGDEEHVGHLTSFMSLPYHLASNNYAYQCLLPPETVFTGQEDPQLQQIRQSLVNLSGGGVLNVVDFGAGKGRLAEALGSDANPSAKFDYIAFDSSTADEAHCREAIERNFGSSEGRFFNDVEQIISTLGEGWADCVVMTNVLHEIPVENWLRIFSVAGLLARILKPDGYLLIVEDQRIPVGEMAHQNGFLLMNTNELVKFFEVTGDDKSQGLFRAGSERAGRLTAHLVSRRLFGRVSTESRRQAIQAIRNVAIDRVIELRDAPKSYGNGLLHGLWTQQLANATLALEQV